MEITKRLSSDSLINCMGKMEYLIEKLENRFFSPRWVLEDISFLLPDNEIIPSLRLGFPMICFCDMTFEDLRKTHLKEYGPFGIIMEKSWGMRQGLNPVTYVSKNSTFISFFQKSLQIIFSNQTCIHYEIDVVLKKHLIKILRHLKPYHNHEIKNGKVYYDEREWRFLPDFDDSYFLKPEKFDKRGRLKKEYEMLNSNFSKVNKNKLKFEYKDVSGILVDNPRNRKQLERKIRASKNIKRFDKQGLIEKIVIFE